MMVWSTIGVAIGAACTLLVCACCNMQKRSAAKDAEPRTPTEIPASVTVAPVAERQANWRRTQDFKLQQKFQTLSHHAVHLDRGLENFEKSKQTKKVLRKSMDERRKSAAARLEGRLKRRKTSKV